MLQSERGIHCYRPWEPLRAARRYISTAIILSRKCPLRLLGPYCSVAWGAADVGAWSAPFWDWDSFLLRASLILQLINLDNLGFSQWVFRELHVEVYDSLWGTLKTHWLYISDHLKHASPTTGVYIKGVISYQGLSHLTWPYIWVTNSEVIHDEAVEEVYIGIP